MRAVYLNRFFPIIVIFLIMPLYSFAAGGGGGGISNSGFGFGSRDAIFILVNSDYSERFSLKNGTKYQLKIRVENDTANVNFGSLSLDLIKDDNYVDLNDNGLADINFFLVKVKGVRADIRIINVKEQIVVDAEKQVIKEEPEEETEDQEKSLNCGNLPSIKDRVSCRLDLEEEDQEEELELYYLPEECRVLTGSERGICIARYKSVQTCWKFPLGDERISCVKRSMRLGTIQEEKDACNVLTGQDRSICVRELKNKIYDLIKWRFYNLEEKIC